MSKESSDSVSSRVRRRGRIAWVGVLSVAGVAIAGVTAAATLIQPHALSAAGATTMTISGLTGGGPIEVESWSFGASQAGSIASNAGLGAGRVTFNPFSITKTIDKSSPLLMQACAAHQIFPTVTMTVSPSAGVPADSQMITLKNAFCSVYQQSASSGDDRPTESLSFNYSKIIYNYAPQGAAATRGGWDLKANVKA